MSAVESACNIGSGMFLAWLATLYVLPLLLNTVVSGGEALEVTVVYAVISLVRSYLWRRYFNGR
jgi:membrane protein implicated in regulation of membrane protease activity